ncbi:TetR/AcrR family transcriptional regulator [Shewanella zhangzhouensis]|uniref:TetR/AcrR family transcriptional regulator n=1 Tax=Shewanella zhangzhouensis TaxID=2864213 RepID=UPI001C65FA32|nr:TetR/AcrR family transcriptional regulator [Shewanella zhangzhouensis]QYK07017.1 TetR/AcrR family transcriptional regulator [Shewanella zhangzhouensis]
MDIFSKNIIAEKLLFVFWSNGYHLTTLQDLQHELDMRPGSIYYKLGNKEALCRLAMEFYIDGLNSKFLEAKTKSESPIKVLKEFVVLLLKDFKSTSPNYLCFLMKIMTEINDRNSPLFTSAKIAIDSFHFKIESLLIEARERGEIRNATCCKSTAILIQSFIDGVRIATKKSTHDVAIADITDDFFGFLF